MRMIRSKSLKMRKNSLAEDHRSSYHVMLNNITNDLDLLLSEFCQLYPDTGEPPPPSKLLKCTSKKPMQFENCSAFGGSSTSGTLTSTDSNLSNKDVRSATLTSKDSNNSVTKATSLSVQSSQIDVFGFSSSRAVEQPGNSERPASQSRSTSGSDLRQITVLERLTKTHPIWFLPTVGRSGAVHLVKNKEIGIFIVRKSSREEIMALSVQFPCADGAQNVDHYLIEPTENGLHLQGSTKLFTSIPHLIAHYCDNKEDLPHRLVLPPSIRAAKTSQELSALAMLGQDYWSSPRYDAPSKSRSSSRSNLSDHSSQMNKSVSEPISINNSKTLVPAYSQSEAILQNTPPKHSVIDFSSYLIRKPDDASLMERNATQSFKSESRLTESVQKSCSVTSTGNHKDHVTSFTCFVSSSEMVQTESSVITVSDNMCNRNSSVTADYAYPDKTMSKLKSNSHFSTPVELLGIPEEYYFRSNLSDKLSDYEDIWKYADPHVGSVQADIVQRLQPNAMSVSNNNIAKGRTRSSSSDMYSEEFFRDKLVVKDLNVKLDHINQEAMQARTVSVSNADESAILTNGYHELDSVTVNQIKRLSMSKDHSQQQHCDNGFIDCSQDDMGDILCMKPVKSETFVTIPEQVDDKQDDVDDVDEDDREKQLRLQRQHDADAEDGDVFPNISSVQTQTSPPWMTKSPIAHVSRRSASTSSLSTMRTPVYSEPFDAINPDDKVDKDCRSIQERKPKLPKKQRRKSAPAVGLSERRLLKSENFGRKISVPDIETEKGIIEKTEIENILEDEEVFVLSGEHEVNVKSENTQNSKLEKLYETAWVVNTQSEVKKPIPFKPKPSPRKTKLSTGKSDNNVLNHKPRLEVNTKLEPKKDSNEPVKFTINVLEQLKTLQEFGESHELPSSPVLNKFPVYEKQTSMETRVSYSEGSTAEDMISSWNPELTLKPIKPFPVLDLPVYSAMSEYDNLNSIPYMAPSHQSVASNGTIFCKPWENSLLGKIMKSESSPSHVKSPPPKETPPPLPPPIDMLERIKAWQESSQEYHDYPNETLNNEYRLSAVTDANSIDAVQSRGDISNNSECRVSSNGQNSQSSEKTLVNEKPPAHSHKAKDKVCENIPSTAVDIREKIAPVLANPRLLNKPQRNRNPDTKIRDYIISLSHDHSTTFGSTIENFIQCTLDSQDTNPFNITRNVRQFMNGIKNYLVKHGEGELEDLIERERSKLGEYEILNIDAIIENSLHECVIQPLKQNIYRLFVNEYTRNGNLKLLSNNIKYARTKTPEEIGIRKGLSPPDGSTLELIKDYLLKMQKSYSPMKKLENLLGATSTIYKCKGLSPPDGSTLELIKDYLLKMQKSYSPMKKLENLLGATSTIYKCVASKQRGNVMCFGADDFLPMLIYVLVHCGTLSVEIEADYMWGLLHPSLLTGEGGYYLTSLSSAVLVLKKFKEMQETKASQQQGKLPSISDMQGFLKIALPNETHDTIEWKTLPVRPSMTTKDVCSMIAHKFKITNPQDYGLYTLENGEECRMMDMECPQSLKADRMAREKECKFVYKRHAANIAWPKSVK